MYDTIYISCPSSISEKDFEFVIGEVLEGFPGCNIEHWYGGQKFYKEALHQSNIVIFILPNFEFVYNIDKLPLTMQNDIKVADSEDKLLLLGYKTRTGNCDFRIYDAQIVSNCLKGIGGSHRKYEKTTSKKSKKIKQVKIDTLTGMTSLKDHLFEEPLVKRNLLLLLK